MILSPQLYPAGWCLPGFPSFASHVYHLTFLLLTIYSSVSFFPMCSAPLLWISTLGVCLWRTHCYSTLAGYPLRGKSLISVCVMCLKHRMGYVIIPKPIFSSCEGINSLFRRFDSICRRYDCNCRCSGCRRFDVLLAINWTIGFCACFLCFSSIKKWYMYKVTYDAHCGFMWFYQHY